MPPQPAGLVKASSAAHQPSPPTPSSSGATRPNEEEENGTHHHAAHAPPAVDCAASMPPLPRWPWTNVVLLAFCFALGMGALFVQASVSAVAAREWASSSVGTVPLGLLFGGTAVSAAGIPRLSARLGLRYALLLCVLLGAAGALMCLGAALQQSFVLLAFGSLLQGPSFAATLALRFAALHFVPVEAAPRAIALVVAGGVMSAAGPELARSTRSALPQDFGGSYIATAGVLLLYALLLMMIDFKAAARIAKARHLADADEVVGEEMAAVQAKDGMLQQDENSNARVGNGTANQNKTLPTSDATPTDCSHATDAHIEQTPLATTTIATTTTRTRTTTTTTAPSTTLSGPSGSRLWQRSAPRTLRVLLLQPACAVAIIASVISYSAMTSIMAATPLAMADAGLSFEQSSLAVSMHSLGRYLPSFVAGAVVARFGAVPVMLVGFTVELVALLLYLAGRSAAIFISAIFFVGAGWSLSFVASSRLLVSACRPAERVRMQAVIDATTLVGLTATTVSASFSLEHFGLDVFAGLHAFYVALGLSAVVGLAVWRWQQHRRQRAETEANVGAAAGTAGAEGSVLATGEHTAAEERVEEDNKAQAREEAGMQGAEWRVAPGVHIVLRQDGSSDHPQAVYESVV